MDGSFSIPAGGLEAAETIRMAAIRETREEVGVEIDPLDLEYTHTLHSLTEGNDWVGHFFTVRVWTGTPRIREPDKHSDLTWCSIKSLPDGTIPYVRQALLCISAGKSYSEFGWSA
jgi:8-oxo-dGTP pyrophosphatase MutT (NUDIX family)